MLRAFTGATNFALPTRAQRVQPNWGQELTLPTLPLLHPGYDSFARGVICRGTGSCG
jgi:hypothetical protein